MAKAEKKIFSTVELAEVASLPFTEYKKLREQCEKLYMVLSRGLTLWTELHTHWKKYVILKQQTFYLKKVNEL